MFERYNDRARRTIFFARYEAARFGSAEITTEHLMLGLLREDQRLCRLCANLDPEPFREEIAAQIPRLPSTSTSIDLPLSDQQRISLPP
jgi:ATP-dependent Clp protease ATP-binding subunit ClpC